MKSKIIQVLRAAGGLSAVIFLNRVLRKILAFFSYVQFVLQWGVRPVPGWFDHYLDLHYFWRKTRTPLNSERGVLGLLAIKPKADVLELCCGNGFNTYHFYSVRASGVVAIDIDASAIDSARKEFSTANTEYICGDIRYDLPERKFNNIIWDASLEYFTEAEIYTLLSKINGRLRSEGIFCGQSMIQDTLADEHKYIFRSPEQLIALIKKFFRNVRFVETIYPTRRSVYFYASDGDLAGLPGTLAE